MKIMSERTEKAIDGIYRELLPASSDRETILRVQWPALWTAIDELLASVSPGGIRIRTDARLEPGEIYLTNIKGTIPQSMLDKFRLRDVQT